jgi:hypothetical protein
MASAVRRPLFITEARFQSPASLCGVDGGHYVTKTGFYFDSFGFLTSASFHTFYILNNLPSKLQNITKTECH